MYARAAWASQPCKLESVVLSSGNGLVKMIPFAMAPSGNVNGPALKEQVPVE
jgi:hypothetical protein